MHGGSVSWWRSRRTSAHSPSSSRPKEHRRPSSSSHRALRTYIFQKAWSPCPGFFPKITNNIDWPCAILFCTIPVLLPVHLVLSFPLFTSHICLFFYFWFSSLLFFSYICSFFYFFCSHLCTAFLFHTVLSPFLIPFFRSPSPSPPSVELYWALHQDGWERGAEDLNYAVWSIVNIWYR
jgi:hypothetical protein